MKLKIGNLTRRHPEFESGLPMTKQLNLDRLGDAGRFKFSGCRRSQKSIFEFISVYMQRQTLALFLWTIETVAKLLCPRKSMILSPILRISKLIRAVSTAACLNGKARRHGQNWRKKGGFTVLTNFAIASIALFFTVSATDSDTLKINDVNRVMDQIFEQHLEQKEISDGIIRHSLRYYIDQFDPNRIYLLRSEVEPFLNPSTSELNQAILEYKNGDFSIYKRLNLVFAQAIERARRWRAEFEMNSIYLFNQDFPREPEKFSSFAISGPQLKQRMYDHLLHYLQKEEYRFGKAAVMNRRTAIFARYENEMRYHENEYLFQNKRGELLSPEEREHYFALHLLKALTKSLDAHSQFYSHKEAYDMRVRLEKGFKGIGIKFREALDGLEVVELEPQGPAAKNGQIQPKDLVIAIDGKSIADEPFDKAMQMIHDEKGPSVTLTVKREEPVRKGKTFDVTLSREEIILQEDRAKVTYESFADGIVGEITLNSFYQSANGVNSADDVRDAILKLKKLGKLRGLVLDFRENGGGFLSQAVKVAGLFITNGVIAVAEFSNGEKQYYRDVDSSLTYDGPLVILTSRLTASAAEIVAQALQDYGVAIIVGDEHTYGKGSIQSQTVTNGGNASLFKVTIGEYYTPSGKTPQLKGVHSDVLVPSAFSNRDVGEEKLDYALTSTDSIAPSYQDNLDDVPPKERKWYLKYYIPTIQHKEMFWQRMIPTLKKNSAFRLEKNKNFQLFLKKMGMPYKIPEKDNDEDLADGARKEDFGSDDLQMAEAVNIVKDMAIMHSSDDRSMIGKQE